MWQSKTLCRWHQSSRCNSRPLRQLLVCCCLFSSVRGTRNVVKSCTWSLATRISSGYLCGYLPISVLAIRNLDWNLCWWFATMYRSRPTFVHTFHKSHRILECSTRKSICKVSWNWSLLCAQKIRQIENDNFDFTKKIVVLYLTENENPEKVVN